MIPWWFRRCCKLTYPYSVWLITLLVVGVTGDPSRLSPSVAFAETRVIPSVSLSERYDSNVFFAPAGSVPGLKPWDFVTTVTPTVQVLDKTRDVETTLNVGGSGNVFVNNSKLNFFSAQISGSVKLDGLVGQLIPGLKLRISDSFAFTPEQPSFVQAGTTLPTENVFARGLQTVRANTYTNTTSLVASYPISQSLSVRGDYVYSIFRVGNIVFEQATDVPVVFFDTDFQRWSIGPSYRLTGGDQVSLNFQTTTADFRNKSSGLGQSFNQSITARGLEAEYSTGTKHWTAVVSAGATFLEDGSGGLFFFSGKLAVSRELDPSTRVSLDVSRQLAPAYFATGGALISTVVGASLSRNLGDSFSVTGSANYALNQATPVEVARFESYSGTVLINYTGWRDITPSVSYQYTHFEVSQSGFGFLVNRSVALLSLTTRWK